MHASIKGRIISVSWNTVPGSTTYAAETQGGAPHIVASGLTSPEFIDSVTDTGTVQYTVMAFSANGQGPHSAPASVTIQKAPMARGMTMH
jgi:hypothetical protein